MERLDLSEVTSPTSRRDILASLGDIVAKQDILVAEI